MAMCGYFRRNQTASTVRFSQKRQTNIEGKRLFGSMNSNDNIQNLQLYILCINHDDSLPP